MDNCVKQSLWAKDVFEKKRLPRFLFVVFTWVEMSFYNMIFSFLVNEHTISGSWANALHFWLSLWLVARCFFIWYFASSQRLRSLHSRLAVWSEKTTIFKSTLIGTEVSRLAMHFYNDTLCLNFFIKWYMVKWQWGYLFKQYFPRTIFLAFKITKTKACYG